MSNNLSSFWNTVLGEIGTEVSRPNFLTLFKETSLLSLENNVATIAVPSTMIIDLLKKRFYPLIKTVLDKHVEGNVEIVFVPRAIIPKSQDLSEKNGPLFSDGQEDTKQIVGHLPRVRADFTFENLAVSSNNQLAYVSAQAIVKNLGKSYNPLFIYGPVGVGKTHLMQAIANASYQQKPALRIVYITSEEFTNEVVEAIKTNNTQKMKKRFRALDLLLVDDVQFLAGKEKVQEELFHTFNILIDASSQIVLSSDRPPSEIKKLEKRLSSRFGGGLTVDIESPDFELRTAILLIKARKYNIDLTIDQARMIAEKIEDTRSLEGVLLRIITESANLGESINEAVVLKVINSNKMKENISYPDKIIKDVCSFYNIKPTQLKGPKRDAFLVRARQVSMFLLKKEVGLSFSEIGNILGGRDHTTVMHGVGKIEFLLTIKPSLLEEIRKVNGFSE